MPTAEIGFKILPYQKIWFECLVPGWRMYWWQGRTQGGWGFL